MGPLKLLLDTHVLLWWVDDSPRLDARWRDAILQPASEVWFSVASLWEIVVKIRTGKLKGDVAEIAAALDDDRFKLLAVLPRHLVTLAGLPAYHRDPFDHLLIAQAISEGATFVSEDRAIRKYPADML